MVPTVPYYNFNSDVKESASNSSSRKATGGEGSDDGKQSISSSAQKASGGNAPLSGLNTAQTGNTRGSAGPGQGGDGENNPPTDNKKKPPDDKIGDEDETEERREEKTDANKVERENVSTRPAKLYIQAGARPKEGRTTHDRIRRKSTVGSRKPANKGITNEQDLQKETIEKRNSVPRSGTDANHRPLPDNWSIPVTDLVNNNATRTPTVTVRPQQESVANADQNGNLNREQAENDNPLGTGDENETNANYQHPNEKCVRCSAPCPDGSAHNCFTEPAFQRTFVCNDWMDTNHYYQDEKCVRCSARCSEGSPHNCLSFEVASMGNREGGEKAFVDEE